MLKLNLIQILKNTILEQAPIGLYGGNQELSKDYYVDVSTGDVKKRFDLGNLEYNEETIKELDTKFPFLIKPSSKRGSPFHQDRGGVLHPGIDYPVVVGTNIVLLKPGVAIVSDMNSDTGGYGAAIYIKHDDGTVTRYGHLSEIYTTTGEYYKTGTIIGKTGGAQGAVGAGNSQGPHLHFEYRVGGDDTDPSSDNNDDKVFRFLNQGDSDDFKDD